MRILMLAALGLAACTASITATPQQGPASNEPATTQAGSAAPKTGSALPKDEETPPAAPDPGAKPTDRPSPTTPASTVRTCDAPRTTPTPLRISNLVVRTSPVSIGAAIIDGAPSKTERWAAGPAIPPSFSGATSFQTSGPDLDASDLLGMTSQPPAGEPDLFTNHLGRKSAFQTWSDALGATSRRLTYAAGGWTKLGAYEMDPADMHRTPTTPTTGQWVRFVEPNRTYVYVLAVTFGSDCALGAMADLLGRRPIVTNGGDLTAGTVLDLDKREKIQELLVRDGAEVMLSVVALRHNPIADDVLAHTTCGPADLTACADALTKLGPGGAPSSSTLPAPDAFLAGTDPDWTATTFGGANVDFLLP